MSDDPPVPPADLPSDLIDRLNSYSPDQLQSVSQYANALAEYKDHAVDAAKEAEETDSDTRPDDLPEEVPSKATITIKAINDNRYYYWQWREGDSIKSKYKGPVDGE